MMYITRAYSYDKNGVTTLQEVVIIDIFDTINS